MHQVQQSCKGCTIFLVLPDSLALHSLHCCLAEQAEARGISECMRRPATRPLVADRILPLLPLQSGRAVTSGTSQVSPRSLALFDEPGGPGRLQLALVGLEKEALGENGNG